MEEKAFEIQIIENIHQKVLAAISGENSFQMKDWHTCETTHCRAGWVIHLAGKSGYELEKRTSSTFAGMMIYKASSPEIKVSPVRFFESNEVALEDIKRCAKLELDSVKRLATFD